MKTLKRKISKKGLRKVTDYSAFGCLIMIVASLWFPLMIWGFVILFIVGDCALRLSLTWGAEISHGEDENRDLLRRE